MSNLNKLLRARKITELDISKLLNLPIKDTKFRIKNPNQFTTKELSKLAYFLGTDSDNLITFIQGDAENLISNDHYLFSSQDGFWGHVGIKLPNVDKSIWYPITLTVANYISNQLINLTDENNWLSIETLNNRLLLLKPASTTLIYLLDDAQDHIESDWSLPIDGYQGKPDEFYKALEEHFYHQLDCDDNKNEVCNYVRAEVDTFTDIHDFDSESIEHMVIKTNIYYLNGQLLSHRINEENLLDCITNFECNIVPIVLDFSNENSDLYIPSKNLCLIDMPKRLIAKIERGFSDAD